ncbi:MAG TPA: AraC family transcriptional regulator [Casimicrobiaceae bacterium]|nr:AraC family transcriptional regulator [Casimicrobiaceae bacterium]
MNQFTFQAFEAAAHAQGFDEVLERHWAPATLLDLHTHPFALRALVVQGEMWLTVGDNVRHLCPGDEFALDCEVPHAERYGTEGATYWVARRTPGQS